MNVTSAAIEDVFAELRATATDPRAGLFEPDGITWKVNRESILFLGAGRAALLQLAHPWVAAAIHQHSAARRDPLGRFLRTFDGVFKMLFGDLEQAFGAARRVHAIHARVTGDVAEDTRASRVHARYYANDEEALHWVHATLLETALQVHELVLRPLSLAEREQYYVDSKRFARLFGISDRVLPGDVCSFEAYWSDMLASDVLGVSNAARELAAELLRGPHPISAPAAAWFRIITAGLLPERFRREFGLSFTAAERALFRSSLRVIRALYTRLPGPVRHVPAYRRARRRLRGAST
jgi:uncharacterized protein (DUF2236 family)